MQKKGITLRRKLSGGTCTGARRACAGKTQQLCLFGVNDILKQIGGNSD